MEEGTGGDRVKYQFLVSGGLGECDDPCAYGAHDFRGTGEGEPFFFPGWKGGDSVGPYGDCCGVVSGCEAADLVWKDGGWGGRVDWVVGRGIGRTGWWGWGYEG